MNADSRRRATSARIQVPHRAGRRISWIGEERLPFCFPLGVDARERGARQEHLAADLEASRRGASQRERDRFYRADVGRDVFASHTVAACRAADEAAVFIRQRDAESVDLQFRDVAHRRVTESRRPAQALVEGAEIVLVVGVVETEHRRDVLDGGKAVGRTAGHALRRRVGRHEVRILRLELLQFVEKAIEFRVGNLRAVVDVVLLFVMPNLRAQLVQAGEGIHRLRVR